MPGRPSRDLPDDLDLASICDGNVYKLVHSYARALHVPESYVFFPLLSCVSSLMGRSKVKVGDLWHEACLLWTSVIGPKGSRKSTVCEVLLGDFPEGSVQHVNECYEELKNILTSEDVSPRIFVHEDMILLFSSLQAGESHQDVLQIKKMYDYTSQMKLCQPSFAGFIPTKDAETMVKKLPDEITSRMLICWPPEVNFKFKDIDAPMPANTPKLKQAFGLIYKMRDKVYTLSGIKETIEKFLDKFQEYDSDWMDYQISKVAGQVARVSAALFVLKEALKTVVYQEGMEENGYANWKTSVDNAEIEAACVIMNHIIKTKYALQKLCSEKEKSKSDKEIQTVTMEEGKQQTTTQKEGQEVSNENSLLDRWVKRKLNSLQSPTDPSSSDKRTTCDQNNTNKNEQSKRPRLSTDSGSSHSTSTSIPANNFPPASKLMGGDVHAVDSNIGTIYVSSLQSGKGGIGYPIPHMHHFPPSTSHVWDSPTEDDMNQQVEEGEIILDSSVVNALTTSGSNTNLSESQQFLGVFDCSDKVKFISTHARRLRKLFELTSEQRITPSSCSQMHIIPPLTKEQLFQFKTVTKYPVIVSKEFLYIVAQLGFGKYESVNISTRRYSVYFEKHRYEDLSEECKSILKSLGVTEEAYMAVFKPRPIKPLFGMNIMDKNVMMESALEAERLAPFQSRITGARNMWHQGEMDHNKPSGGLGENVVKVEPIDITDEED